MVLGETSKGWLSRLHGCEEHRPAKGTDAQLIYGIEPSSVMMDKVSGRSSGLRPQQQLVEGPTAGMLYAVERLYATREDFVSAWSPHWMNRSTTSGTQGPQGRPGPDQRPQSARPSRGGALGRRTPKLRVLDALELTEDRSKARGRDQQGGASVAGARRWVSENREVVRPGRAARRPASQRQPSNFAEDPFTHSADRARASTSLPLYSVVTFCASGANSSKLVDRLA